MPMVKAKTKLSISDSGYGSVDHADSHGVEAGLSAQLEMTSSLNNQVSEYCEICCEESEKRRYFSNNADRRSAHPLTNISAKDADHLQEAHANTHSSFQV